MRVCAVDSAARTDTRPAPTSPPPLSPPASSPPPLPHSAISTAFTVGGYGPGKFSAATTASTDVDQKLAKSDGTAVIQGAYYGGVSVVVRDTARPTPTSILG